MEAERAGTELCLTSPEIYIPRRIGTQEDTFLKSQPKRDADRAIEPAELGAKVIREPAWA